MDPAVAAGTANVTPENEPKLSVCTGDGIVGMLVALKLTVIVDKPAKPWPVTVTGVPTGPVCGLRLMEALTLKVVVA